MENNCIKSILVYLKAIRAISKRLHYESYGTQFYGIHLLSDKFDFRSDCDRLIETHYLGSTQETPPTDIEIAEQFILLKDIYVGLAEESPRMEAILSCACELCTKTSDLIEGYKSDVDLCFSAGTVSILDQISEKILSYRGLLRRTLINF
jgi:hypothetical protein